MTNPIDHTYQSKLFQLSDDGFFNMTHAANSFGKKVKQFFNEASTGPYLQILEELIGEPVINYQNCSSSPSAIWGHPKLACFFMRWLDVRFATLIDMLYDDVLHNSIEIKIANYDESLYVHRPESHFEMEDELTKLVHQENARYSDWLNSISTGTGNKRPPSF